MIFARRPRRAAREILCSVGCGGGEPRRHLYLFYTEKFWGSRQAGKYLDGLFAAFENIVSEKALKRPIPVEFEVHGFVTRYQGHFIYWQEIPDGEVFIVAVIHTARAQGTQLRRALGLSDEF
jgi:plasmid stabilization system protein ParE